MTAPASAPRRPRAAPKPRTPGTTRIVLHGALKKQFGGPFDWGCPTPANAIYALCLNAPGFRQEFAKGQYRIVRGKPGKGVDLDVEMLRLRFGEMGEMHIIPVAVGAGSNGGAIAKIVIGVAAIALAVATAGGAIGAEAAAGSATAGGIGGSGGFITGALGLTLGNTLFGVTAGALGLFGAGMLLGGIGDILSKQPKPPAPNASFILSGPLNTTTSGGPIPLAYGPKIRVGSTVISSGYEAVAVGGSTQNSYGGTGNSGGSYDNFVGYEQVGGEPG